MTFEETFGTTDKDIISLADKSVNINFEALKADGTPIEVAKECASGLRKISAEYYAVKRAYRKVNDGSPSILDAKWNNDRKMYLDQAQYLGTIFCQIPTKYLVCGSSLASYLKLSANFKHEQNSHSGVYKSGTLSSGIEVYVAPSEVIPTDEFLYWDLTLETFRKGKIKNLRS